jgi:lipopolysaccharide heptosyltransferase III
MKILFITSTRIGDAVLSTGLLRHLAARHPGARITVACGPVPAPLFAAAPGVERVIALEKRPLAGHWLRLWFACAPDFWDLIVDLRRSAVSRLLFARERRNLGWPARGHQVERLATVLALDPPPAPRLWIGASEAAAAARLIPAGTPVMGLGPTANWPPKSWPADRFAALAARLTGPDGILPGARIAVFGAAEERAAAQPILDSLPAARRIDLVGRAELGTVAACLARLALYVGNDSGLTHMAAAVGTPTLALFGPSRPEIYGPWGERTAIATTTLSYDELTGAPGYDHRNFAARLMDTLSVDAAAAAAVALWRRCQGEAA